jgi:hypothetical protein
VSLNYALHSTIFRRLEELIEENTEPATLADIWRFAKDEHKFIFIGLIATAFRGRVSRCQISFYNQNVAAAHGQSFQSFMVGYSKHYQLRWPVAIQAKFNTRM